jgi:hypothetical protein
VENDKYFLTVLRYIYQNPIKAKIVDSLTKYPWSGYNEYFGKNEVCDINFVLSLFSDDKKRAMKLFENSMLKKIPGKFRVMKKKEDTK